MSLTWQGEWTDKRTYQKDDVVHYSFTDTTTTPPVRQGNSYCALRVTSSSNPPNTAGSLDWALFIKGGAPRKDRTRLSWRGVWNSGNSYDIGDVVRLSSSTENQSLFVAQKTISTGGAQPDIAPSGNWATLLHFSHAVRYQGMWESQKQYEVNDIVEYMVNKRNVGYIAEYRPKPGIAPDGSASGWRQVGTAMDLTGLTTASIVLGIISGAFTLTAIIENIIGGKIGDIAEWVNIARAANNALDEIQNGLDILTRDYDQLVTDVQELDGLGNDSLRYAQEVQGFYNNVIGRNIQTLIDQLGTIQDRINYTSNFLTNSQNNQWFPKWESPQEFISLVNNGLR